MQGTPAKAEHDRMHHIMVKNWAVGDFSLPPGTLCINQIVVHNLHSSNPIVVHPLYPLHLILCLEQFGDALTGHQLFFCYQIVINADNKKQQAFRRTPAAFKYFRIIQHILSQKTHYSHSTHTGVFLNIFD